MKANKLTWCFGLILAASTCFAQSRLDQSFTGPYGAQWLSFAYTFGGIAQAYTAGITGDLTSVRVSVFGQYGGPVVVQILDTNNGSINGNSWSLLGYTMVTPPDNQSSSFCSPTCGLTSVAFSPPIPQTAGTLYTIAVYPTYFGQIWVGSTSTRYTGGGTLGTWVSGPDWAERDITSLGLPASFYFQTYVKTSRKK